MSDTINDEIIHRELETEGKNPGAQVAEIIAGIEEKEPTELTAIYDCIDGVLDNLFSNPPSPEAQMEIEFSYETYRVTVEQNGNAKFVKTT